MRKGTSKYDYADQEEATLALRLIKKGQSNEEIAIFLSRDVRWIRELRATYFPSTELASHYLRANALTMAQRVVAEGDVKEMLDVLSRPNIGVLDPIQKHPETQRGIFISTTAGDLGGVAVAVIDSPAEPASLEPGEPDGNDEFPIPRPHGERRPIPPLALVGPWTGHATGAEDGPARVVDADPPAAVAPVVAPASQRGDRPRRPGRQAERRAPHVGQRPAVPQHGSRRDGQAAGRQLRRRPAQRAQPVAAARKPKSKPTSKPKARR